MSKILSKYDTADAKARFAEYLKTVNSPEYGKKRAGQRISAVNLRNKHKKLLQQNDNK